MKVAVIGGGPSGLATLKFLRNAHKFFPIPIIDARLFEAEENIGGTFVHRVYEDAELVSSKYLTAFSDFRLPFDAPDFVTPAVYVEYLKNYASHFDILDSIECNTRVTRVQRGASKSAHIIHVTKINGQSFTWECDAVAVCTGLHVHPRIPKIPGIERVDTVLHSSQLKTRKQFGSDTDVIVLGCGETGMDIAHLAVTSPTRSVTICHRDGFFCAPKIIPRPLRPGQELPTRPNKPVDTSVASLFDTAYAHPILQKSPLLWLAYDTWVKKMHWLISGTEEGPDQWVGQMSPARKHLDALFMVKSDRAIPYLSAGHRSISWWNRFRSAILNVPIKDNKGRKIDVAPWLIEINKEGAAVFQNTTSPTASTVDKPIKPDVVVFATGYDTNFSFLDNNYPALHDANMRGVYKSGDVSVGFVGFVRPSIGAIPPLGEMQAQFWVLRLLQQYFPQDVCGPRDPNAVSQYEMDYQLHPRAGYDFALDKRGVDHESYAYQLALDMGSAPTITYVMKKGWKVFFTWAMGSNFNPKFRLVGPWKWDRGAEEIMCEELFHVVKRSGGGVYLFTYTIIPFFVFGFISTFLYALTGLYGLATTTYSWCMWYHTERKKE